MWVALLAAACAVFFEFDFGSPDLSVCTARRRDDLSGMTDHSHGLGIILNDREEVRASKSRELEFDLSFSFPLAPEVSHACGHRFVLDTDSLEESRGVKIPVCIAELVHQIEGEGVLGSIALQ